MSLLQAASAARLARARVRSCMGGPQGEPPKYHKPVTGRRGECPPPSFTHHGLDLGAPGEPAPTLARRRADAVATPGAALEAEAPGGRGRRRLSQLACKAIGVCSGRV